MGKFLEKNDTHGVLGLLGMSTSFNIIEEETERCRKEEDRQGTDRVNKLVTGIFIIIGS